jgi:type IV pilus assembly protein PilO
MQDIVMEPAKDGVLNMDAVVKTYRYLDDEEVMASKASKKQVKGQPK